LYCERIDEYDMDGVAALFTPDCVTDYGPGRGGEVAGRAAVRARIAAGQAQFRRAHHQLGQSRVWFDTLDRVGAVTYVTASHEEHDGSQWQAHLRYLDVLPAADYHPDGYDDHGFFKGNAWEFADSLLATRTTDLDFSSHVISNVSIDLRDDEADVESYHLAARARPDRPFGRAASTAGSLLTGVAAGGRGWIWV
jgi:hypothetical protein